MLSSRREFLIASLGGLAGPAIARAAERTQFRIGVTDWNLQLSAQPAAVKMAKRCGFAGS